METAIADPVDGLVCAYELDGRGGARPLDWTEVRSPAAEGAVRWIHVDFTHPNAVDWLSNHADLEPFVAEALSEDDSRPRSVESEHGVLAILRGVNMNPGSDPEDMISIRLWIEPARIVSARRRRLRSIRALREDFARGTGPTSAPEFLVSLVERLGDRIGPVIDALDTDIESTESRLDGRVTDYRGEYSSLRRQAVRIRRFLAPQRDGVVALSKIQRLPITSEQRQTLREEADRITRYLEDLDLIRERAMVAQEELMAALGQEQNRRMYLLSIIAALFLPLSFLTGLMGMNVAGLPGTEEPSAFMLLVLMMSGVAAGILIAFRLKKWL